MLLDEGPQTHRRATLIRSDAVKEDTEDLPHETGAAATTSNIANMEEPDVQETQL